jgi:hypothetical protein
VDDAAAGRRRLRRPGPRTPARRPWLAYYRVVLGAPGALERFGRLAGASRERYGWMYLMAGRIGLIEGQVPKAEEWLELAAAREPADGGQRALAEARLVLGRREAAYEEMERAARVVPPADEGLLMAWRAAFDLWLGDHAEALERLDRACALGSPHAYCWRGAALLMLGRSAEALDALDLALRLYPGDLEAYVWRAEAKRALGRHAEALEELSQPPLGVWVLVNRALAKAALETRGAEGGLRRPSPGPRRARGTQARSGPGRRDRRRTEDAGPRGFPEPGARLAARGVRPVPLAPLSGYSGRFASGEGGGASSARRSAEGGRPRQKRGTGPA